MRLWIDLNLFWLAFCHTALAGKGVVHCFISARWDRSSGFPLASVDTWGGGRLFVTVCGDRSSSSPPGSHWFCCGGGLVTGGWWWKCFLCTKPSLIPPQWVGRGRLITTRCGVEVQAPCMVSADTMGAGRLLTGRQGWNSWLHTWPFLIPPWWDCWDPQYCHVRVQVYTIHSAFSVLPACPHLLLEKVGSFCCSFCLCSITVASFFSSKSGVHAWGKKEALGTGHCVVPCIPGSLVNLLSFHHLSKSSYVCFI